MLDVSNQLLLLPGELLLSRFSGRGSASSLGTSLVETSSGRMSFISEISSIKLP